MSPPVSSPASSTAEWLPPSDGLRLHEGLWVSAVSTPVSYPDAGNEACFQVEDDSYWFRHRMDCISAVMRNFAPAGTLYDIGGGNGFVAAALQRRGLETVLLEPGPGAVNALRRGVRRVIQSTLADAGFRPGALPAAGAFDVLEHLPDDLGFLRGLRDSLTPGARFYCTVPALSVLWSAEDDYAGHHRRYSRASLASVLTRAGFEVEFLSFFFSWLIVPVFALRALPTRLGLKNRRRVGTLEAIRAEHRLPPAVAGLAGRVEEWELQRLRARRPVACGTSLLCVARVAGS